MMRRTKRTFTKEFRVEAVKLVLDGGRTCSEVARAHDLAPSLLAGWVRQAKTDVGEGPKGALTSQERAELRDLRKRLRDAEMENTFLKKCSAFFARQLR